MILSIANYLIRHIITYRVELCHHVVEAIHIYVMSHCDPVTEWMIVDVSLLIESTDRWAQQCKALSWMQVYRPIPHTLIRVRDVMPTTEQRSSAQA